MHFHKTLHLFIILRKRPTNRERKKEFLKTDQELRQLILFAFKIVKLFFIVGQASAA